MVFKNILYTSGTRILNALVNLLVLLLITNFIGSKGLGIISLIVLDVTVIQLFTGLLAGGSLIYFASRYKTFPLLLTSYVWILFNVAFFAGAGWLISLVFPGFLSEIVPVKFETDILFLAFLNGFMQIHYNLLIGQKRIPAYNLVFVFQTGIFFLLFLTFLLTGKHSGPDDYVLALYISWITAGIAGLYLIMKKITDFSIKPWKEIFVKMWHYGLPTQSAVMLHIGNKRLSYYFLRIFSGLTPLGIYSAGVQLTEGLRLIGQSISLVQYSVISNSRDKEYVRLLTVRLMKFSLLLTFSALIILWIIPQNIYQLVFSRDFGVIKIIVWILSPGVIFLAANTVFSHFFSGIGKPEINLKANLTGFGFTVLFAFILIPPYGYIGAAATASLNYMASVIYQYFVFRKITQTRFKEWLIRRDDIKTFRSVFTETFLRKNSGNS